MLLSAFHIRALYKIFFFIKGLCYKIKLKVTEIKKKKLIGAPTSSISFGHNDFG